MRLSNKNPDASERTPMPETSLDRNLFLANYFAQRTPTPETSLDRNLFLAFFFLLSKPLRQRLFFFWTVAKSQDNGADKLCLCFVVFFFCVWTVATAEDGGADVLQPQPGHLSRILPENHEFAHLRWPPRYPWYFFSFLVCVDLYLRIILRMCVYVVCVCVCIVCVCVYTLYVCVCVCIACECVCVAYVCVYIVYVCVYTLCVYTLYVCVYIANVCVYALHVCVCIHCKCTCMLYIIHLQLRFWPCTHFF